LEQEIKNIITGCIANDRRSQELLYRKYFHTMMGMCMRHTQDKSEAQMILNNGFLKVFKKIDTYSGKGSFEGWIRKIVYHSISDYFRSNSKYLKFLVFEEYDSKVEGIDEKLHEEDILKMIKAIPESSAAVFTLYCIEGYTHKEIAELKNISVGTSKWHLANARKKLQELILQSRSNNNRYVNG